MAQANDIYQVRSEFELLGQQVVNVWWYQVPASGMEPLNAPELASEFHENVWGAIAKIITTAATTLSIQAVNWRDPSDYGIVLDATPGESSLGEKLPSYVSMTFRSGRPHPGTRYSYKRFGGLTSTHVDGNTPVNSGNDLTNIATALGVSIVGSGSFYVPVQVRTSTLPDMGTGLPFAAFGLNGQWTYSLGTQYTRKKGVGA